MFSDEHYNSAHIIHVHNIMIHFVLMYNGYICVLSNVV